MNGIYVVGLTGPTGSGKTTVANMLASRGISVVNADNIARKVTEKGTRGLNELIIAFGTEILNEDGSLNRKKLAQIAFADKAKTKLLNDITHPLITIEIRKTMLNFAKAGATLSILDAPLLFESGVDSLCDDTVAVLAPSDVRIERIIKRDNIDHAAAYLRMSAQPDDDFYKEKANHIIFADVDEATLKAAVSQLEYELRRSANDAQY